MKYLGYFCTYNLSTQICLLIAFLSILAFTYFVLQLLLKVISNLKHARNILVILMKYFSELSRNKKNIAGAIDTLLVIIVIFAGLISIFCKTDLLGIYNNSTNIKTQLEALLIYACICLFTFCFSSVIVCISKSRDEEYSKIKK